MGQVGVLATEPYIKQVYLSPRCHRARSPGRYPLYLTSGQCIKDSHTARGHLPGDTAQAPDGSQEFTSQAPFILWELSRKLPHWHHFDACHRHCRLDLTTEVRQVDIPWCVMGLPVPWRHRESLVPLNLSLHWEALIRRPGREFAADPGLRI